MADRLIKRRASPKPTARAASSGRDARDRLAREIGRSTQVAVVNTDVNGEITGWNHAAEQLFGYTFSEALGQGLDLIMPAPRQSDHDELLHRVRSGETVDRLLSRL